MKYLIDTLLVLCFLIFTCSAQTGQKTNQTIYWGYKPYNPQYIPSSNKLIINNDGVFLYEYRCGFQMDYSTGRWDKDLTKKKLILTSSFPSTDSLPLNLVESSIDSGFVRIDFNGYDDTDVQWHIVLNGQEYPIGQNSSITVNDISVIDSFYIKGYKDPYHVAPYMKQINIRSLTYYPTKRNNHIQVSLPPEIDFRIFYYIPLHDTLKIRGDKLIWKRKNWSKTIKLKKKKSE